jgi:hypothetical protein
MCVRAAAASRGRQRRGVSADDQRRTHRGWEAWFADAKIGRHFDCFAGTIKERTARRYGVRGVNLSATRRAWMVQKTPYRVKAESIEACNCQHGCNCQFGGYPNEGKCEFIVGFDVKDGMFGDVSLNGLRAVVAAKYPKAIHEGNGHVILFIDDKASDAQVNAFATILSGQAGGMPWEALAGTIGTFEGPIRKPIDITVAGEKSLVRVPGSVELQLTPFKDIMSGQEKEVHIVYPKGGFFWNDAKIATTETMRAQHGDFALEWPQKYAAAAEVNWTNQ